MGRTVRLCADPHYLEVRDFIGVSSCYMFNARLLIARVIQNENNEETSLLRNRRFILSALITSPLLLYSYLHEGKNRSPDGNADSDDFVIVNGWVLLKEDIAE